MNQRNNTQFNEIQLTKPMIDNIIINNNILFYNLLVVLNVERCNRLSRKVERVDESDFLFSLSPPLKVTCLIFLRVDGAESNEQLSEFTRVFSLDFGFTFSFDIFFSFLLTIIVSGKELSEVCLIDVLDIFRVRIFGEFEIRETVLAALDKYWAETKVMYQLHVCGFVFLVAAMKHLKLRLVDNEDKLLSTISHSKESFVLVLIGFDVLKILKLEDFFVVSDESTDCTFWVLSSVSFDDSYSEESFELVLIGLEGKRRFDREFLFVFKFVDFFVLIVFEFLVDFDLTTRDILFFLSKFNLFDSDNALLEEVQLLISFGELEEQDVSLLQVDSDSLVANVGTLPYFFIKLFDSILFTLVEVRVSLNSSTVNLINNRIIFFRQYFFISIAIFC
ncbi:hypothetical protein AGLY_005359 [Aphis glycines]|uniref:Uncharacterized protein n=1 Tax=Aphis glycines TaxID=307491 RepID=A0A6G0TXE4_APHGL|nr:hypothetical protein AGLY_005359 [Aphis glycines]